MRGRVLFSVAIFVATTFVVVATIRDARQVSASAITPS
jgi:hypothetical protein